MAPVIDSFTGDYFFLSNFYEHSFDGMLNGMGPVKWKSVEHYYQAAKAIKAVDAAAIANAATPGESKKMGRKVELRPTWEADKLWVMRVALNHKFNDPALADQLLGTDDALLVEGNTWGDRFWGVCRGEGRNWLGHLLMARRAELRASEDRTLF